MEKIRHSLAHIMAMAVKNLYGEKVKFGIGPAIEDGFYYDFDMNTDGSTSLTTSPHKLENRSTQIKNTDGSTSLTTSLRGLENRLTQITPEDLPRIEKEMRGIIKQNIKFEKKEITTKEAKKLFKNQPYKLELINELEDKIYIYESGNFIDLCGGQHIKSSKEISSDAFKLIKIAGAYWEGDESRPMLQRIYGVSFETKKELDEYLKLREEAEKRDHRKIGQTLDLFSFHEESPGAPFWHPKGMIIFKELEKWWRQEHEKKGYLEINTPIMAKKEIFEKSGHWEHYKENMFVLKVENETYVLKPMNCPESALIYSSKIRSYKDLPLRLAEIGRLHRNELSGVLAGMFRVRQITMDDAHIYCRQDQIQTEIQNLLRFIKEFYKIFNFKPVFKFATRPEKFMGDPAIWQKAEKSLEYALKKNKLDFETKPKDGAFYGPKIDVHITDALKRSWQMATIQLDFQMPERFNLFYVDEKGNKQRPVIIHRAIFGSFERFIGILLEHFGGAMPLWLSPVQARIIPVASRHKKYAKKILDTLNQHCLRVHLNEANETVGKKIREAEIQKIPYILVVGDKEEKSNSASVRERKKGNLGITKLDKFIKKIIMEIEKKK